jgi:hypothetical protein
MILEGFLLGKVWTLKASKRVIKGIMRDPVVTEMFGILTQSMSIFLLSYTIAFQDVTIGEN